MIEASAHPSPTDRIEAFIARWQGREGGQERANYAMFLSELCAALDLDPPEPADATRERNNYVFERAVDLRRPDGVYTTGRIDLYKRGSFVLEAKQSRLPGGKKMRQQLTLDGLALPEPETRGRRSARRGWDTLMWDARNQAEIYAKALPGEWPPFLLVCDVGHCIELYADFSGQGKNYAQFPDRQGFRCFIEDLRDEKIRDRLRRIWLDPHSLDPTRNAARATRKIAERLAAVSKSLEAKAYPAETVAMFLMRCLFTMFAEDVSLLPEGSFAELLQVSESDPTKFPYLIEDLWRSMNLGGFASSIRAQVKMFNGNLFADARALPLGREEIGELRQAAAQDWTEVEPAIFGTLLEQALDPAERKRLGAHYTPRAYVQKLVAATMIEPLRADWEQIQVTVEIYKTAGDAAGAISTVKKFHETLLQTRVLDPACGTGNFLYVALELLKRLEGEVLEALADLGGQEVLTGLEGSTVDPHQFLGLELNPRAAAIAELVLWIGYLQWHFRTKGAAPAEPILKAFKNINAGGKAHGVDAVLAYDGEPELIRDEFCKPKTRQGEAGGRVEIYRYRNPRRPIWPAADYIIGNPPFIGGKDIRGRLGEGYAEALWAAHPHMNESADFVMYWWDHAADLLSRKSTRLKRFGFVTTNSITQEFSRRVMARHLKAKKPISLVMAIPDHPWTKATRDAAAVRIAMSVAAPGK
ncbi:MAG: DNA methyltransferase [Aliidongia sp.]